MAKPDNAAANETAPVAPQNEERQFVAEEEFVPAGEYVGFWKRLAATMIDVLMFGLVTFPLLYAVYGERVFAPEDEVLGQIDFALSYLVPPIVIVLFWHFRRATPGKMAISAIVVDARTHGRVPLPRLIGRCFAYVISLLPLGLGFIWIAFDRRKQGWHDKLANTVVIYEPI